MYVEGGGNLRLLPTSQVHRQSLWRDKDHESISIRVRLGVAHRPVRRTRESLVPLRMAQGFLMEIWPLQKLNRCLPRGHNVVCSLVQWKRKAKATDPSCCSVCSSWANCRVEQPLSKMVMDAEEALHSDYRRSFSFSPALPPLVMVCFRKALWVLSRARSEHSKCLLLVTSFSFIPLSVFLLIYVGVEKKVN